MLEIIRSDKLIGAAPVAPARTAREPRGTAGAVPAGEAVRWCDDFQLMMNTRPEYAPPRPDGVRHALHTLPGVSQGAVAGTTRAERRAAAEAFYAHLRSDSGRRVRPGVVTW